jgi:hypothetical protein
MSMPMRVRKSRWEIGPYVETVHLDNHVAEEPIMRHTKVSHRLFQQRKINIRCNITLSRTAEDVDNFMLFEGLWGVIGQNSVQASEFVPVRNR